MFNAPHLTLKVRSKVTTSEGAESIGSCKNIKHVGFNIIHREESLRFALQPQQHVGQHLVILFKIALHDTGTQKQTQQHLPKENRRTSEGRVDLVGVVNKEDDIYNY